jgi:hypothetical protein
MAGSSDCSDDDALVCKQLERSEVRHVEIFL